MNSVFNINLKFEQGIRFLVKYFPESTELSRKPVLFHDIRVGVYLYEQGYSEDIVLGGLLHDTIEWSKANEELLGKEFGDTILNLVLSTTKDDSIKDKYEKANALVQRCINGGVEALIIKAADIIDSFKWYSSQNNAEGLEHCVRIADAIIKYKPAEFNDKIFSEVSNWLNKYKTIE